MDFDTVDKDNVNPNIEMEIVGIVMIRGFNNFEAFKRTMNQIWAISKDALFRSIENGLFVIQFAKGHDKSKVLEGRA